MTGAHDHDWGPLERSWFSGTLHRKCRAEGCRIVSLLDDDEDEEDPTAPA